MKSIYLDNSAATPIDTRVLKAMAQAAKFYANPSSYNTAGRLARAEMAKARAVVARFLSARSDEVVFTSSGSEANNLGILGSLSHIKKGIILTTPIEHKSVLAAIKKTDLTVKYIPVNREGIIDIKALENILETTSDIRLVSVMYANNEVGSIQPIPQIGKLIHKYNSTNTLSSSSRFLKISRATHDRTLFHVDGCQAALFLDMNVQRLGVDLLSFDGCKIYGPHGTGVLYIRRGTPLTPLVVGAGQEHGHRAGTENIQNSIGIARAVELVRKNDSKKISALRDYAFTVLEKIPAVIINGPKGSKRLPNNIHIAVAGLSSEMLLLELDTYGIYAGSGSACASYGMELSPVLKAIGVPKTHIEGALRFSLGRSNTKSDVDYLESSLRKVITQLEKRFRPGR